MTAPPPAPPADPDPELVERIERGLAATLARVEAAGGDPEKIVLVAVTKGFGVDTARAALAAGLRVLGENYANELLGKAEGLGTAAEWHYLGSVQRRKVRALAPAVSLWQSVARLVEGEEIVRHSPGAQVLVEVDATGLPGRGGVPLAEAPALVAALRDLDLSVRGLMTVAAPGGGAAARELFAEVAKLADRLELLVRSMGMSGDLEEAVRAGSTMVRVGEALFGPRPPTRRLAQ